MRLYKLASHQCLSGRRIYRPGSTKINIGGSFTVRDSKNCLNRPLEYYYKKICRSIK